MRLLPVRLSLKHSVNQSKKRTNRIVPKPYSTIVFFLLLHMFCGSAFANDNNAIGEKIAFSGQQAEKYANPVLSSIHYYRKYISSAIGNHCPMYPSCSMYCIEAFKKHGFIMGWIMTSDRLIRCGRDELKLSPPIWTDGRKRCYDPVSNNDFWW